MRLVVLESPYSGRDLAEVDRNIRYARACMADCIRRGEAPYASHLLFTQPGILRDEVPEERKLGIAAAGLEPATSCVRSRRPSSGTCRPDRQWRRAEVLIPMPRRARIG